MFLAGMISNVRGAVVDVDVPKKSLPFSPINSAVTFEHRHENKSCSACHKDQHEHLL